MTRLSTSNGCPTAGLKKTLVAEKQFRYAAKANPGIMPQENITKFCPYSTDEDVLTIGKCKGGWNHEATLYVADGGEEFLLGKEDA